MDTRDPGKVYFKHVKILIRFGWVNISKVISIFRYDVAIGVESTIMREDGTTTRGAAQWMIQVENNLMVDQTLLQSLPGNHCWNKYLNVEQFQLTLMEFERIVRELEYYKQLCQKDQGSPASSKE
jgi:hypothetical protein